VGSKGQVLPGAARLLAAFGGCSLPPLLSGHTFMREMEFQWWVGCSWEDGGGTRALVLSTYHAAL
jgi:hypothetical protein